MTTLKSSVRAFPLMALSLLAISAMTLAREPSMKPVVAKVGNGATQRDVARLTVVEGNVLLSHESGMGAVEGTVLIGHGARIITTADSRAKISFDDECLVVLGSNQRLVVDESKACAQRVGENLLDVDPKTSVANGPGDGTTMGDVVSSIGGEDSTLAGSVASGATESGSQLGGLAVSDAGVGTAGATAPEGAVGLIGAPLFGGLGGAAAGAAGLGGVAAIVNGRVGNTASPN